MSLVTVGLQRRPALVYVNAEGPRRKQAKTLRPAKHSVSRKPQNQPVTTP